MIALLGLSSAVPVWLAETVAVVTAFAAALAAVASLVMAVINWRKLDTIHETQKRIGRHQGMTEEELG